VLFRSALVVAVAVGVYLATTAAFRLAGCWRGSVSEGEYAERLREIDSPLYTHVGGIAAGETAPGGGALVRSHGDR
jgi:hypothetical protein